MKRTDIPGTTPPAPPRRHKQPRRPASSLAEKWTVLGGRNVFYRESADPVPQRPVMVHVHGFGLSGRYMLPTAERLSREFHTYVPDLPGFGRSDRAGQKLGIEEVADSLVEFLDDRGVERATFVGNSMGCPVILELAYKYPDRIDRAVLVAPAGGLNNQPFLRAARQLALDGLREPPSMIPVAVPDYLRFGVPSTIQLFSALTRYPSLERLLKLEVPTLAVLGRRDPLLPSPERVREIAARIDNHVVFVVIDGAAHAINFSHAGELAHAISLYMADQPITDDPNSPGVARVEEIHRGTLAPSAAPGPPEDSSTQP